MVFVFFALFLGFRICPICKNILATLFQYHSFSYFILINYLHYRSTLILMVGCLQTNYSNNIS